MITTVVCRLPNGSSLYRETNGVGGFRYWSDEVGGGVCVWDTSLVNPTTLLCAIVEEKKRNYEEYNRPNIFSFRDVTQDLK
jgi:hypothetical protein